MAGIDKYLDIIKKGVFGRDVRKAIHDGIAQVYEDATFDGNTNMEVAKARGKYITLDERLTYLQQLLSHLSSNVNSLTVGKESSAEVMAARSAVDGALYRTLSDSIKSQFLNIYSSGIAFVEGYIDLNGNNASNNDLWYRTDDFYPIETIISAEMQARPGARAIAYYDENKNFISGQGGAKIERITQMVVPQNARFVRFCFHFEDPTHAILTTTGNGIINQISKLLKKTDYFLGNYEVIDSLSDKRITDGFYIDSNNQLKPSDDFAVTDYFRVRDIAEISIPSRDDVASVAYYDYSNKLIGYDNLGSDLTGINNKTAYIKRLQKNSNTIYVRFSIFKNNSFCIILNKNTNSNILDELLIFKKAFGINILTSIDAEQEGKGQYISLSGEYKSLKDWNSLYNLYKISDIAFVNIITMPHAASIAYYDSNKTFIGSQGGDGIYTITKLTPPENATFVRFCFNINHDVGSNFVILKSANSILDAVSHSESIKLRHPWHGKEVGFIGDSITAGVGTNKTYHQYLSETIGIINYQQAVSGAQISSMLDYAKQLKVSHPDLDAVFLFGGTNDFNNSVPIGDFYTIKQTKTNKNGQMVTLNQRVINMDHSTFKGRLNNLASYLKSNFPDSQIIFMTPLHRAFATFGSTNVQPDETFANTKGLFIDDYVQAVREACNLWSITCIDLYQDSGLYPLDSNYYKYFANNETDHLHPNNKGHKRLAKVIASKLDGIPADFK